MSLNGREMPMQEASSMAATPSMEAASNMALRSEDFMRWSPSEKHVARSALQQHGQEQAVHSVIRNPISTKDVTDFVNSLPEDPNDEE